MAIIMSDGIFSYFSFSCLFYISLVLGYYGKMCKIYSKNSEKCAKLVVYNLEKCVILLLLSPKKEKKPNAPKCIGRFKKVENQRRT